MNFRKICLLMIIILVGILAPELKANEIYFTTMPTISPDASQIVFCYEGDLWTVDSSGGIALRLTAMEGIETSPCFSPDGQWLAFSAQQDGNSNVYIMPVNGGKIRQLTFHEAFDRVDSWSWDSKYIYFTSKRHNYFTTFKVNREGGTPQRLFPHYFNTLHSVKEHPLTGAYFFSDSDESFSFVNRRGYKGENNPDIKSYNPQNKEFKSHTEYIGKDLWHTLDQKGNIYFVSDRFKNQYNLFQLKDNKKIRLTDVEKYMKRPQVSANGEMIVFEMDYQLYTYHIHDKKIEKIDVQVYPNDTLQINQEFNVEGKITYFDLSPDGKKFSFVSRGELFVSDIKGKFIKKINTSNGRVDEVKWLKDSKTLLFSQTTSDGWFNLFKIAANREEKEKQLTFDSDNNHYISLNHDFTKAVYISGINQIKTIDLTTLKSKTIVRDEFWTNYNSKPRFSPDGQYILYTTHRNSEEDIFILHLESGKTINVTHSGTPEIDPQWSPDGKYIYFAANRFKPFFFTGNIDFNIFRLPFYKYRKPTKFSQYNQLFEEKEANESDSKNQKKLNQSIALDKNWFDSYTPEEMMWHWEQISPANGDQISPFLTQKDDETIVLFISNQDGDSYHIWKTKISPFKKNKTEKIKGTSIYSYSLLITCIKDQFYALLNGKIGKIDIQGNSFKAIPIEYSFQKNMKNEFQQMFSELWASLQENFYDENFHGKKWGKIKTDYLKFLPYLRSRGNFRVLVNDMLGELNSSHMGFRSRGKEEKTFYKRYSIETGILFRDDQPFRVKKLVNDSPVDKKEIDIQPGDLLIAVNSKKIDPSVNREFYFTAPNFINEIQLTFKREKASPKKEFTVTLHPTSNRIFRAHLYDEWIRKNQKLVDEKSNKQIAYIHMKNMGTRSLRHFLIEMTTEGYFRQGIILDLRYNTGGSVHDEVLRFLSQKIYSKWKYRGGQFFGQSSFSPANKPIVLLVNEQSLSDAEFTAAGFKELKLGKIIGTETYRWLIYTNENTLVDGSVYRLPSWGAYRLDNKNIERTGVQPDIYVKNTFLDRLNGKDPQLETAIQEILKQLNTKEKN